MDTQMVQARLSRVHPLLVVHNSQDKEQVLQKLENRNEWTGGGQIGSPRTRVNFDPILSWYERRFDPDEKWGQPFDSSALFHSILSGPFVSIRLGHIICKTNLA